DGYFFEPLWTTFRVSKDPGILDWYTVLAGVLTLVIIASHGAHFVALKTSGATHDRAARLAIVLWPPMGVLSVASLLARIIVRPGVLNNFGRWPIAWSIPLVAVGAAVAALYFRIIRRDLAALLASSILIAAMLGGAAFAMYPLLLASSRDGIPSLTTTNTLAPAYGLTIGLRWWSIGFVLAVCYFAWTYRSMAAKVAVGV